MKFNWRPISRAFVFRHFTFCPVSSLATSILHVHLDPIVDIAWHCPRDDFYLHFPCFYCQQYSCCCWVSTRPATPKRGTNRPKGNGLFARGVSVCCLGIKIQTIVTRFFTFHRSTTAVDQNRWCPGNGASRFQLRTKYGGALVPKKVQVIKYKLEADRMVDLRRDVGCPPDGWTGPSISPLTVAVGVYICGCVIGKRSKGKFRSSFV